MIPKLMLLVAFIIISVKIVNVIHNNLFLTELCKDGFYDGGIKIQNANLRNVNSKKARRSVAISSRPQTSTNYASYGAYKKMKALS